MDVRALLKNIKDQKKKVLVVGLGISGIATSELLTGFGITVIAIEEQSESKYRLIKLRDEFATKLISNGGQIVFGGFGESQMHYLDDVDLAILSPGISLESTIVTLIDRNKIPRMGELEFGCLLMGGDIIAVTGSNGKSTTVSLVSEILTHSGLPNLLCGNIGIPITSLVERNLLEFENTPAKKLLVVECSSYQLETCKYFKPKVATWINISDNHLERHGTIERYRKAKAKIFSNQDKTDFAVLNRDDDFFSDMKREVKGTIAHFGFSPFNGEEKEGAFISYHPIAGEDTITISTKSGEEHYSLKKIKLLGRHNRANIGAAILTARLAGATQEGANQAINEFEPLSHRLQIVSNEQGRVWINDSKSTTVAASVAALRAVSESFATQKIILLLGGQVKVGSWAPLINLINLIRLKIGAVICFGGDGRIIYDHIKQGDIKPILVEKLVDAVNSATQYSGEGDIILLSPGAASFDEFTSFEDRGEKFEKMILNLKNDR